MTKKPARRIVGVSLGGHLMTEKDKEPSQDAAPQASPLPWRESDGTEIVDSEGTLVAIASHYKIPYAEALKVRALIVRRVNQGPAFDAMEEALESALEYDDYIGHTQGGQEVLKEIRAALKLANEAR